MINCVATLFCLDTSGVERESAEGRERHNNSPLCGGRDESEHVHAGDDAAGAKDDGKHDAATDAADAADGVENGHGRPGHAKDATGSGGSDEKHDARPNETGGGADEKHDLRANEATDGIRDETRAK